MQEISIGIIFNSSKVVTFSLINGPWVSESL